MLLLVPAQQVLQRRRGEEDLLPQAQLVPGGRGVGGIEDARHGFQPDAVGERADVVAAVEVLQRQRVVGARRPQPQRVDVLAAPAGDRGVVGDRADAVGRAPDRADRAVGLGDDVDAAAEADLVGDFRPLEFPRIAGGEPVLGQFELPAVLERLAEDAVVVADPVAVRRDLQRRHALHEARGEPTEAAVAQRRVGLELAQPVEVDAELGQSLPRRCREAEVPQRVEQQAADQELEREVVDALAAVAIGPPRRVHPAVDEIVAGREAGGDQPVVFERVPLVLAHRVLQLLDYDGLELGHIGGARRGEIADGFGFGVGVGDHVGGSSIEGWRKGNAGAFMAMARTNTRHLRAAAVPMNPAPAQSVTAPSLPVPRSRRNRTRRDVAPRGPSRRPDRRRVPGSRVRSAVAPQWRTVGH